MSKLLPFAWFMLFAAFCVTSWYVVNEKHDFATAELAVKRAKTIEELQTQIADMKRHHQSKLTKVEMALFAEFQSDDDKAKIVNIFDSVIEPIAK